MTTIPKFPSEADKEYYLSPVSTFTDMNSMIDGLPEDVLLTEDPQNVYNVIKTALFTLVNLDGTIVLPVNIKKFIRKVYGHFSRRKTKAKFLKAFNNEVEANQSRVNARKVAQERNNTYLQAQLLGVTFTRQGLDEFEQEYTNNINPHSPQASTSHHSPQASTTPDSPDTTNHHSPQA
ncbi:hypothetical protein EDC94DRAFT_584234 [Helicostylum pulchrum]|nr:hypothetical protein EDC94DRAFT_584234 [Helicostylum pulchrum]